MFIKCLFGCYVCLSGDRSQRERGEQKKEEEQDGSFTEDEPGEQVDR